LFLSAGNVHRAYGSKLTDSVRGAMRATPLSGSLLFFGFLASCGSPPFAPFASEFTIVSGAFSSGHYAPTAIFLTALLVIFVGMGATVLGVVMGEPSPPGTRTLFRDRFFTTAPILGLMLFLLWFGICLPPFLTDLLEQAVNSLAPLS
jgi:hydrogenase-4 component F